ncbi:MAG: hypothetical protein BWY71_01961 [Planctomycetes bacterium ADurb.Bin412]|nr:MAG: hypothetical protein BWY71_01961 [Planctomycetes bacterium ADurb.Bin412]
MEEPLRSIDGDSLSGSRDFAGGHSGFSAGANGPGGGGPVFFTSAGNGPEGRRRGAGFRAVVYRVQFLFDCGGAAAGGLVIPAGHRAAKPGDGIAAGTGLAAENHPASLSAGRRGIDCSGGTHWHCRGDGLYPADDLCPGHHLAGCGFGGGNPVSRGTGYDSGRSSEQLPGRPVYHLGGGAAAGNQTGPGTAEQSEQPEIFAGEKPEPIQFLDHDAFGHCGTGFTGRIDLVSEKNGGGSVFRHGGTFTHRLAGRLPYSVTADRPDFRYVENDPMEPGPAKYEPEDGPEYGDRGPAGLRVLSGNRHRGQSP